MNSICIFTIVISCDIQYCLGFQCQINVNFSLFAETVLKFKVYNKIFQNNSSLVVSHLSEQLFWNMNECERKHLRDCIRCHSIIQIELYVSVIALNENNLLIKISCDQNFRIHSEIVRTNERSDFTLIRV